MCAAAAAKEFIAIAGAVLKMNAIGCDLRDRHSSAVAIIGGVQMAPQPHSIARAAAHHRARSDTPSRRHRRRSAVLLPRYLAPTSG
jgi:hypothetical protein